VNPPEQREIDLANRAAPPQKAAPVTELHPAGATATLLPLAAEHPQFRFSTSLVANAGAGANARLRARPWLTIGHWPGNIDAAARCAAHLVDNAVRHGKAFADGTVTLRMLADAESGELLIEVDDANPDFPNLDEVAKQSGELNELPTGTGLWWVHGYHGRVFCDQKKSVDDVVVGKTVQVILPAVWEGTE
jgi:hypothetical protein